MISSEFNSRNKANFFALKPPLIYFQKDFAKIDELIGLLNF